MYAARNRVDKCLPFQAQISISKIYKDRTWATQLTVINDVDTKHITPLYSHSSYLDSQAIGSVWFITIVSQLSDRNTGVAATKDSWIQF